MACSGAGTVCVLYVVELRSLAELIGPYGMKHFSEGLMRQISGQVDEIKVNIHQLPVTSVSLTTCESKK